jgi:UDP-GlcNAc:undecaprenyl-phosphate/decaprenyl-phosphate GlcNAc-1-phosphate transferase
MFTYIAKKKKVIDIPSARKEHSEPTALLGGVAIYFATIISITLFSRSSSGYLIPVLIVGATGVAVMGLIDDILSLSAKRRVIILFIIAVIVYIICFVFYLDTQRLIERSPLIITVFSLFIIIWIVGITNAINFSDGLDGLASYLSIVSVMSFAIIFAYQGRDALALPLSLALVGAIAGFIPYNRNPAMIFMGDAGSMFIGFMLSLLSISSIRHEVSLFAMVVPVYILFVPILDMCMSILRRIVLKKSIMKPDKMHFHHQLNKHFSNHILVVIILAFAQVVFCTAGIMIFIYKLFIMGWIILGSITLIAAIYTIVTSLKHRKQEVIKS